MYNIYDIPPEVISQIVTLAGLKEFFALRKASRIFHTSTSNEVKNRCVYMDLLRSATPRDIAIGMKLAIETNDIDTLYILSCAKCKYIALPSSRTIDLILDMERQVTEINERDEIFPLTEILLSIFRYALKIHRVDIATNIIDIFNISHYWCYYSICYQFCQESLEYMNLDLLKYVTKKLSADCSYEILLKSIISSYPIEYVKYLLGRYKYKGRRYSKYVLDTDKMCILLSLDKCTDTEVINFILNNL